MPAKAGIHAVWPDAQGLVVEARHCRIALAAMKHGAAASGLNEIARFRALAARALAISGVLLGVLFETIQMLAVYFTFDP